MDQWKREWRAERRSKGRRTLQLFLPLCCSPERHDCLEARGRWRYGVEDRLEGRRIHGEGKGEGEADWKGNGTEGWQQAAAGSYWSARCRTTLLIRCCSSLHVSAALNAGADGRSWLGERRAAAAADEPAGKGGELERKWPATKGGGRPAPNEAKSRRFVSRPFVQQSHNNNSEARSLITLVSMSNAYEGKTKGQEDKGTHRKKEAQEGSSTQRQLKPAAKGVIQ